MFLNVVIFHSMNGEHEKLLTDPKSFNGSVLFLKLLLSLLFTFVVLSYQI